MNNPHQSRMSTRPEHISSPMEVTEEIENSKVSTENFCRIPANKFARLIKLALDKTLINGFLDDLVHSVSCDTNGCNTVCEMFKSVKVHYDEKDHSCGLTQLYRQLRQIIITRCKNNNCKYSQCIRKNCPGKENNIP